MYKLSHYVIISAPVDEEQRRLAYSTRSGHTLLLPEICYEFLKNDLTDHIPASVQEQLVRAQILVQKTENELGTIMAENHAATATPGRQLVESIQPTASCQLGCYYCGQQHTKKNMADDVVEKLTDRIHLKFISGGYTNLYLGWFGGEPLMGFPQMRMIYKRLKEKINNEEVKIGGKIVTNGLSLKEPVFEELVTKFHVDQIEITLDGTGDYHDSHRYTKKGTGSFDLIYNNLKTILQRADYESLGCSIIIRCNVDEKNVDGVEPLIRLLAADGLHTKIARLYFVGIYSWGGNDAHKASLTKEKMAMLTIRWQILKIKLGYPYSTTGYKRKLTTCMATGGNTEIYDAYGNIYNCSEISYADFYNGTPYQLGTLQKNTLDTFVDKPLNDWYTVVRDTEKYPCHHCKLLPVCGGSCPKSWVEGIPACPPFKFNILKELELKYLLCHTAAPQLEERLSGFDAALAVEDFKRYE
ncbi:radical SAM/SPASM domain-containing protein [Chitinophaga sp. MM2321]|uniref:radical SAM/SPASM domain-containing protein n=1 Tax=Chitinophaga sp. MM2321 TaxID=3137178 RepID=UPI0032D576E1